MVTIRTVCFTVSGAETSVNSHCLSNNIQVESSLAITRSSGRNVSCYESTDDLENTSDNGHSS